MKTILALALVFSTPAFASDVLDGRPKDVRELDALTRKATRNQKSEDAAFEELKPLIEKLAREYRQLKDRELTFANLQRKSKKGILTNKKAKNLFLVSHGNVEFSSIRNSILVVHGNVLSRGYIRNSIIICTGKVQSDRYLRESIVVSYDQIRSKRYIRDAILQAPSVLATDYSRDNVYKNTPKAPKNGKRDRHLQRPSRLFKKRPKLY